MRRRGLPRKEDDSLIDWTQPERNAHVLDWRQRAHEFGLQPGDETDEAVVLPARQLVSEDDPEAFEDQQLDEEDGRAAAEEGEAEAEAAEAEEERGPRPERRARTSTSCASI